MDIVELSKLIVEPPAVTFIGIDVAFTNPAGTLAIAVTFPEISSALLASFRLEIIVVFAFCVVAKPMFRTTKAKAAATITNAISTIADSTPIIPRWVCLCPF